MYFGCCCLLLVAGSSINEDGDGARVSYLISPVTFTLELIYKVFKSFFAINKGVDIDLALSVVDVI